MENNFAKSLEDEFLSEAQNRVVTIEDLTSLGVSEQILKEEALLRNIYGDKILLSNEDIINIDDTKKTVTKIDLNEIEKADKLKAFVEEISKNETNSSIDYIVAKLAREENE